MVIKSSPARKREIMTNKNSGLGKVFSKKKPSLKKKRLYK